MATTTKKDLIERVAAETQLPRGDVRRAVQSFLEHVIDELSKGNRLEFRDFGVFGDDLMNDHFLYATGAGSAVEPSSTEDDAEFEDDFSNDPALHDNALAEAERIVSVDLNPVRVLAKGQGVVALDALIVPAGWEGEA